MAEVFAKIPATLAEFQELADQGMDTPENTAALFFVALEAMISESRSEGLAMINVLKGPQPMSRHEESFLKDRIMDKPWLARAYFQGATPENNYAPNEPLTLIFERDTRPQEPGFARVYIKTPAFDSKRGMQLRSKGGKWYIWEYSAVVTGVRIPVSEDPWA
ncbi:MAG: hypothetical protein GX900_06330 [Clostridiaceae bacterium]|nr:hypothetical protein [Clostridiaceae bacterium]